MKILKVICFIVEMFAMGLAIVAPFANPLWFIYSFIVCVVILAYGKEISMWTGSFMEP